MVMELCTSHYFVAYIKKAFNLMESIFLSKFLLKEIFNEFLMNLMKTGQE